MKLASRVITVVLLGALGALATVSALAWACTPQAHIYVNPASGPSGSLVTVAGRGFTQGPVQIYWKSTDGAPIAAAAGPAFSVSVKLPDAAPGVYYVVARSYNEDGSVAGEAPRAFRVTAPTVSQRLPAATKPARATPRPAHDGGARRREATAANAPRPVQPAAHAGGQQAAKPVSSAGRATLPRAHQRRTSAGARSGDAGDSPSRQSVSADLWSGFRTGQAPALGLTGAAAAGKGPGWQLAGGIGLLSVGFLGLLGTLAGGGAATPRVERGAVHGRPRGIAPIGRGGR